MSNELIETISNLEPFKEIKFGTPQPITFMSKEYGPVHAQILGTYSLESTSAEKYIRANLKNKDSFSAPELLEMMKFFLKDQLEDTLQTTSLPLNLIHEKLDKLSLEASEKLSEKLLKMGVELKELAIKKITIPDITPELTQPEPEVEAKALEEENLGFFQRILKIFK